MVSESQNVQWRREYRSKRYMEHISVAELNQRAADVITNVTDLTVEGKLGVVAVEGESGLWWRKWTEVLEEFQLRFGPYPTGISKEPLDRARTPNVKYPPVPPEYLALATEPTVLLKLGQRAHMQAMIDEGAVRIAPASSYKDPSLNAAVHDDELSFESIARPGATLHVSKSPDGPFIPLEGIHTVRMTSTLQTDFFVYCMTMAASPRLFGDFEADACVAITNPEAFLDRLGAAVAQVLPEYQAAAGPVIYADPHDGQRDVVIAMTKHFRYSYQHEYRVFWVPRTARMDLEPFLVSVGNLYDCAKLITL